MARWKRGGNNDSIFETVNTQIFLKSQIAIVKGFFSLGAVLKFTPKIFIGYEYSNLIDLPNVWANHLEHAQHL